MDNTPPLAQRLQAHRHNTRRMLAPGLKGAELRPLAGLGDFGGLKYVPMLRAMRALNPQRLGSLRPETANLIGRQIPQKFANAAAMLRLSLPQAGQSSIWSEVEQVYPASSASSGPEEATPGGAETLRRGMVIPKLPAIPQPGQSIEAFKSQVQSRGLTRPPAPARKPPKPGDPGVRRFSRIEEISASRPPESPAGSSASSEPPAAPPVIQRQPEDGEAPRASAPFSADSAPDPFPLPPSESQPAAASAPQAAESPPPQPALAVNPLAATPLAAVARSVPLAMPQRLLRARPSRPTPATPAVPRAMPSPPKAQAVVAQPPARPNNAPEPGPMALPKSPAPQAAQPTSHLPSLPAQVKTPPAGRNAPSTRLQNQPPLSLQAAYPAAKPGPQPQKPAGRLPVAQPAASPAVIQRQADQPRDAELTPAPDESSPPAGVPHVPAQPQAQDPQPAPMLTHLAQRRAAPQEVRFVRPERARPALTQPARPLISPRTGPTRFTRPGAPATPLGASRPENRADLLRQPAPALPPPPALSAPPPLPGMDFYPRMAVDMPVAHRPPPPPPSLPAASHTAPAPQASPSLAAITPAPSFSPAPAPPVVTPAERAPESPIRTKPPVVTSSTGNVVQRLWEEHQEGASGPRGGASGGQGSVSEQDGQMMDLDKLAEEVLPFVKRLIEIESERARGYSR